MDIKERIIELKKKRNALIIAHHYAPVEVHEIADVLSDSRGFFESMKDGFDADVIVVIAPTFFAELAAALLPDKIVLVPVKIECPVAMHRDLHFGKVSEFKALHPGIPLVCYATSPFQTKLLADAIALPGEVVQTIQSIDADKVIFVGERNCGEEAAKSSGKKVILYPNNPVCNVYDAVNMADVAKLRKEYPNACLMVHPECKPEVCEASDHVIGTGAMHNYIKVDKATSTYVLGTELGFCLRMQNEFPEKKFIHLSPYLQCNVFKPLRIETICDALENMKEEIEVDKAVARAVVPLFSSMLGIDSESSKSSTLDDNALVLLKEACETKVAATIMMTNSSVACKAQFESLSKNSVSFILRDCPDLDFRPLMMCFVTYYKGNRTVFFATTVQYYIKDDASEPAQLILKRPPKLFWTDTRQSFRVPVSVNSKLSVQVKNPAHNVTFSPRIIDIGYDGILIDFQEEDVIDLSVGNRLSIELRFGKNVANLEAEVRVRRGHENHYGLSFLETTHENGVMLHTIVSLL